jgi:AmmeMemoRadiSam system protein B
LSVLSYRHAGYRYSGHVMAHSYRHVVPDNV